MPETSLIKTRTPHRKLIKLIPLFAANEILRESTGQAGARKI